jgi:hypothetical protein
MLPQFAAPFCISVVYIGALKVLNGTRYSILQKNPNAIVDFLGKNKLSRSDFFAGYCTSDMNVSSPPASNGSTFQVDTSVSLLATTAPADPAPITMKSYSFTKVYLKRN